MRLDRSWFACGSQDFRDFHSLSRVVFIERQSLDGKRIAIAESSATVDDIHPALPIVRTIP